MKSRLLGAGCAALFAFTTLSANAALVDNGGLIYDDVLDITWAQPDNALRNWDDANTWAAGLTLGGVSGWRLPYLSVAAGAGPLNGGPVDCSTATELACRDNEFGYMFYHNLGGTIGQSIPPNGDPDVLALFPSLQPLTYWYGDEVLSFRFENGLEEPQLPDDSIHSWAVHAGNVVPVPAAVWLFGSGLLGLVGIARRKKPA